MKPAQSSTARAGQRRLHILFKELATGAHLRERALSTSPTSIIDVATPETSSEQRMR